MAPNDGKPAGVTVKQVHAIRILFDPETNELKVDGPLDNGVLFLGMLEMAKVVFDAHRARRANQNIVEAPPGLRL